MKLYYMPGTCAMASHIVMNEIGIPASLRRSTAKARKTADGENYYSVNSERLCAGAAPRRRGSASRERGDPSLYRRSEAGGRLDAENGLSRIARSNGWVS